MLLPKRAGQQYVPSALRGLMEPGSPIASFYHVCPECMRLGDDVSEAARAVLAVSYLSCVCCDGLEPAALLPCSAAWPS